jgi:hypothetical protein
MAKELLPVVLRLKAWRAQNDISQAEDAQLFSRRGLPVRLRVLQAWEAGPFPRQIPSPRPPSQSSSTNIPLFRLNAIRADQVRRDFMPKPGVYRSPWRDFPDVVI